MLCQPVDDDGDGLGCSLAKLQTFSLFVRGQDERYSVQVSGSEGALRTGERPASEGTEAQLRP